jgi:Uma2 family endonuclease
LRDTISIEKQAGTQHGDNLMATVAPERPEILSEPEGLYEVVDGRVVEKTMGVYECWLAGEVFRLLVLYLEANPKGRVLQEMMFDLRPTVDRERRPDVSFVSYERWPRNRRVPHARSWAVVPDLAVEVVSTTNTADEIVEKVDDYFRVGVQLVWVVYPRQCWVHVYRSPTEIQGLTLGDEFDGGEVLPGFRVPLDQIFQQGGE